MSRELEPWERGYLQQLGRRVRVCRLFMGLTQEELAAGSGVHRVTLSSIERGDHAAGVLTYLRLSRPLGVWMGALLVEESSAVDPAAGPGADRAEGLPS